MQELVPFPIRKVADLGDPLPLDCPGGRRPRQPPHRVHPAQEEAPALPVKQV